MATVLRSSLDVLLPNLQQQLMTSLGWGVERVIIDTEEGDMEENTENFQADQVIFLRKPGQSPGVGFQGMGRIWCPQRVPVNCKLWTRCNLDNPPGFQEGMVDANLGYEVWAKKIRDALYAFQPVDSSNNWLVQQPLEPGPENGPRRRRMADKEWARGTITVYMTYSPELDQSRQ